MFQTDTTVDTTVKARGIGAAVGFDWALMWQFLLMFPFFIAGSGPGATVAHLPLAGRIVVALALLIPAAGAWALGEALRRGWRLAWIIQIVFNSALILYGFGSIVPAIDTLRHGLLSGLVRAVVLLIVDPIIVYLLTRPQTRAWLAQTTHAEANARHSGWWIVGTLALALIGGAAIAFGGYY
ncbi:MAG: hypothetical protein ABI068_13235 [Ktedonobacterales bacterium]